MPKEIEVKIRVVPDFSEMDKGLKQRATMKIGGIPVAGGGGGTYVPDTKTTKMASQLGLGVVGAKTAPTLGSTAASLGIGTMGSVNAGGAGAGAGAGLGTAVGAIAGALTGAVLAGVGLLIGFLAGLGLGALMKVMEGINTGIEGIMQVIGAIGKMIGMLVMPIVNLLIPLMLPFFMLMGPVARILNLMLRPVMLRMMESMKAGTEEGGPMVGFTRAMNTLLLEFSKLFLIIMGESLKVLNKILLEAIITPFQMIAIIIGGVAILLVKIFEAIVGMMGGDTSGFGALEGAMKGMVVNVVAGLEIFKQTSEILFGLFVDSTVESFTSILTGLEKPAAELNTDLTLTQALLVAVASAFDADMGGALEKSFLLINQTTAAFQALLDTQPTTDAKLALFNATIAELIANMLAGQDPASAYANAVLAVGTSTLTATGQLGDMQKAFDALSASKAISQLAALQAAMDSLHPNAPGSTGGGAGILETIGKYIGGAVKGFGVTGNIGGAILGGAMNVAGIKIPGAASGGHVEKEGLAYVHAGEDIVPASKAGGGVEINMPINISGGGGLTQAQIDRIMREVQVRLQAAKVSSGGM